MRIRITFAKQGPLRYTGHLDLHKLWERKTKEALPPVRRTALKPAAKKGSVPKKDAAKRPAPKRAAVPKRKAQE